MKSSEELPTIVVDMLEDDSEDETMKALVTKNNDEDDFGKDFKSFNKLAPDDGASVSGHR